MTYKKDESECVTNEDVSKVASLAPEGKGPPLPSNLFTPSPSQNYN